MSDKQFLTVSFDVMNNNNFRRIMSENKGVMMTWLWLRKNIVRAPMDNPYLRKIHDVCFMNGLLATTIPFVKLMKILGVSDKTLTKNIHILEDSGYIKIIHLNNKKPSAHKPQNVYVLGKWKNYVNEDGMETTSEFMFVDEIISSENRKKDAEEF